MGSDFMESEDELMIASKVVLLGDGAVGKTSIRRIFMGERFQKDYLITLGADFAVKNTVVNN